MSYFFDISVLLVALDRFRDSPIQQLFQITISYVTLKARLLVIIILPYKECEQPLHIVPCI